MPDKSKAPKRSRKKNGVSRFNFIISEEVQRTFEKAQREFDLKNKVDALRFALSVLDVMADEIPKGNRIVIQAPDGTPLYEIIPPRRDVVVRILSGEPEAQDKPAT
jgi:hypothetical protein